MQEHDSVRAVEWSDGALRLLDQRRLPWEVIYVDCPDAAAVAEAIRAMVVRGAPAIGVTAAYGVVLAAEAAYRRAGGGWRDAMAGDLETLRRARPTAVNLAWALARMEARAYAVPRENDPVAELLAEAEAIHFEDVDANRRMGRSGASLINPGSGVLTHCNTGSLATGGFGTALGVIRTAWADGRLNAVYADETRPWLQGSRLTAWELAADGIPVELLAEGAAPSLMRGGAVQWVIVGADRIAANGDVANKIGTYGLALAAHYHDVRFMVVAPTSTIDPETPGGAEIPIEVRAPEEILYAGGRLMAPENERVGAWNPVFDVTPAEMVDVLVTERGVVHRPDQQGIERLLE